MDNKKFIEKLQEVAEVEFRAPKTIKEDHDTESPLEPVRYNGEIVYINRDTNPTLGVKVKKIKPSIQACQMGCGEIITNQIIESRYVLTPYRHWRERCGNCGKYTHPSGEGFVEDSKLIYQEECKWLNKIGLDNIKNK